MNPRYELTITGPDRESVEIEFLELTAAVNYWLSLSVEEKIPTFKSDPYRSKSGGMHRSNDN